MSDVEENDVYAVFVGTIDQDGLNRLAQGIGVALNSINATAIHLMMQSLGGGVGEGSCLYNLFRRVPVPLTVYNSGQLCSIAAIAYLGAPSRIASPRSSFMIHPVHFSPQGAPSESLKRFAETAAIDDSRVNSILKEHLTLTEEQWAIHSRTDLWLTAEDALAAGMVTEIGEFAPPPGRRLWIVA
jgi:ATP-dependent Clp protease, protease subunit